MSNEMKDWLADNEQEFYYETKEEAESCYPIGTELMLKPRRQVVYLIKASKDNILAWISEQQTDLKATVKWDNDHRAILTYPPKTVKVSGYKYVEDNGWLPCYKEGDIEPPYPHPIILSTIERVTINY